MGVIHLGGRPTEKQRIMFSAKERNICYGGARAGGKSWAIRFLATVRAMKYPGIGMLLIRRTYPDLYENHVLMLRKMYGDLVAFNRQENAFYYPNGSRLKLGYCANDGDLMQYQGRQYDHVFIDEATQLTPRQLDEITACCRGATPFPKHVYYTCNPGGPGHSWVKRLFIDRDFTEAEKPEDYRFIQATVYDNPAFLAKDPDYVHTLERLPEELRRAWLLGDWTVFVGQYFTEFRLDIHTMDPFPIPEHWRRYFVMDYGLDMFAGYWIALDEEGRAYVYREYCESGLIVSQMVEAIREATGDEQIYEYIAPPDMWNRGSDTGRSVVEVAAEAGISFSRASNQRVAGWLDLREWLRPFMDPETGQETARLRIFRTCRELIRCLPLVQYDERYPNDVAREPHELTHSVDALRYFVAGRPAPEEPAPQKEIWHFEAERPKGDALGDGDSIEII